MCHFDTKFEKINISCSYSFINLIPQAIEEEDKFNPCDFVRIRVLTFTRIITFILSIVGTGKDKGIDTKLAEFFRNARRADLFFDVLTVHRSSFTKAREKVNWEIFHRLLKKSVSLAYDYMDNDEKNLWHGMSVFAIDGSKFDLPATDEIRLLYDPESGLDYVGKGHYPKCLISTLYDLLRDIPIDRTVVPNNSSEREEVKRLLPSVPENSVLVFDRGYPSYDLISYLKDNHKGYYLFRCPASSTFKAVEDFIKFGKDEDIIYISPSQGYLKKNQCRDRKENNLIKLRVIKVRNSDGTLSVLLTNLLNNKEYTLSEIIELYSHRWGIENFYRDEKSIHRIEIYHSKTINGILQELYAILILSVITRTLMSIAEKFFCSEGQEIQFKNAMITVASEAAVFASNNPIIAAEIFYEILEGISKVKYYRSKEKRASQERISKGNKGKWEKKREKTIKKVSKLLRYLTIFLIFSRLIINRKS